MTKASPVAVAGAAPGLEQFGLQLPKRPAAEGASEWIGAFLGSFASQVLCLLFVTVYAEARGGLVPLSICRCMRRSLRRSLQLPYFHVNRCGLEGGPSRCHVSVRLESDLCEMEFDDSSCHISFCGI